MKKAVAAFALLFVLSFTSFAATPGAGIAVPTLPVEQIKPGMKGVALTVFQGALPESMDLEVIGVLRNQNGPRGDIILVRLLGSKPEYTGVVAGMSGSPVYIDHKLVGALAFRLGTFSKEAIAGITPIADMLEIDEMDRSVPPLRAAGTTPPARNEASGAAGPGRSDAAAVAAYQNLLQPIETPLAFSGFTEDAVKRFAPQFAAAGIVPVMGVGGVSSEKQPEPVVPGSAISAVLVRGDMDITATCTVTYVDADRLLACGHPLMQYGMTDMPMTKANVLATLASPLNSFKIVNHRNRGRVGAGPPHRHSRALRAQRADDPRYPHHARRGASQDAALRGPEQSQAHPGGHDDHRFQRPARGERVRRRGDVSPAGADQRGRVSRGDAAEHVRPAGRQHSDRVCHRHHAGRALRAHLRQPGFDPKITGVELDFELLRERRSARLESARTDLTEVRPGDEIVVETVLRPYRGEPILRSIKVRIPASTPKGQLRILVSDGQTLDRMRGMGPIASNKLDLRSVIALLNKEHANHRLYVSLLEANPQAMVEDKVMPTLPLSVMNVMDGMRGTQDMVVTGESAVNESSTALDYVVTGAQVLTVTVK